VGFWKVIVDGEGGGGRAGVSGTGREFAAGACRRRGCSLGKRSRRFGIVTAAGTLELSMLSVVAGILILTSPKQRRRPS